MGCSASSETASMICPKLGIRSTELMSEAGPILNSLLWWETDNSVPVVWAGDTIHPQMMSLWHSNPLSDASLQHNKPSSVICLRHNKPPVFMSLWHSQFPSIVSWRRYKPPHAVSLRHYKIPGLSTSGTTNPPLSIVRRRLDRLATGVILRHSKSSLPPPPVLWAYNTTYLLLMWSCITTDFLARSFYTHHFGSIPCSISWKMLNRLW